MGTIGTTPPAVPGQFIIGFKPGTTQEQRDQAVRSIAPRQTESLDSIDGVLVVDPQHGLTGSKRLAAVDDVVAWVQPNYLLQLREPVAAAEHASTGAAVTDAPNDPEFPKQYHLDNRGQSGGTTGADVKAVEAWRTSTGTDVVVAIADTNVDITHPDLRANIWVNEDEIPGNGKDDDANGYVDDVNGWNFGRNTNRPQDGGQTHGTHVAGLIGAATNNALGVAGMAPDVKLMPLAILTGGSTTASAVKAFDYAVKNGANVISNSWGNNTYEPALAAAVAQATKAGALVVVAAGNEDWDTGVHGSYPDNYAGSIAIAASDDDDAKARYSNRGKITIDVAAPGDKVLSTLPGSRYAQMSGTSMAAPVYSGVAALVKARYPELTMQQVAQRIHRSVQRDGSAAAWNGLVASGGRIDAAAALLPIAKPTAPAPAAPTTALAAAPVRLAWDTDHRTGQRFEVQASLNASASSAVDEGFETTPARAFRTSGDGTWAVGTGNAKEGERSFQVARLTKEQQAVLELTETLPEPTEISFWYKGTPNGELSFFVNRDLQFQPVKSDTWQQFTTTLPAGEHTLSWLAAGRSGATGTFAIDGLRIGKVSDAQWTPVGSTAEGETTIEWEPERPSVDAAVRVRAHNGRWAGDWVAGTPFVVR